MIGKRAMAISLPVDNAVEEQGQGWVNAGEMHGVKSDGEQEPVWVPKNPLWVPKTPSSVRFVDWKPGCGLWVPKTPSS